MNKIIMYYPYEYDIERQFGKCPYLSNESDKTFYNIVKHSNNEWFKGLDRVEIDCFFKILEYYE